MSMEMEVGGEKVQVGLDRLVFGIPYPKPPKQDGKNPVTPMEVALHHSKKKEFVAGMKYIENTIVELTSFHITKTQNKDLKRYKVLSEVDDGLLCVFSLGFSYGTGVINVEVNPSRMTMEKWAELLGFVDVLFDGGYQELYTKGVVAHAEFCIDVSEVDLSSLVLIGGGRSTFKKHKGTSYLGCRGSDLVITMYDKAKEQKQEGLLVRIEARINRRDIRFQALVEQDLFNPFSKCLVVEVNQLQSIAQQMNNPKLANHIIEFGLSGTGMNIHARKAMLSQLQKNCVAWWQPEIFWGIHKELLQQLKPGQICS